MPSYLRGLRWLERRHRDMRLKGSFVGGGITASALRAQARGRTGRYRTTSSMTSPRALALLFTARVAETSTVSNPSR